MRRLCDRSFCFFQAEDGRRDIGVTGVQTCALPVAAERLFGWRKEEALGQAMRELIVPPEYRDRHDARRQALIDSDAPLATEHYEAEFQRRDGIRFPAEATVSKLEASGEVFVSGFITDLTERLRRD